MKRLFTSEAVTIGHPDKICDQIADAILYECLIQDPESHVACEVACTTGTVILMGEITTGAQVDYKDIARGVLKQIGYTDEKYGISATKCSVVDMITCQSPEINEAVEYSLEYTLGESTDPFDKQGAGDQGIMFGYACDETEELMPLAITLAHDLARSLEHDRQSTTAPSFLRPDGKTQVTVAYDENGKISHIDTILISTQHEPTASSFKLQSYVTENIIFSTLDANGMRKYLTDETKIIVNPSGSFTIGGPYGDTGVTGRKLAVDTYGGYARFGGGAMSGKDPSKVDRSAAYMARYLAKQVVASGLAKKCEVQLSYAIGLSHPVSVHVDTFGTGIVHDETITDLLVEKYDLRPAAIIDYLGLKEVDYYQVSRGCHFGNREYPWESIDSEFSYYVKYVMDATLPSAQGAIV